MKWGIEEIVKALINPHYPQVDSDKELALQLFNPETMCGIGIDNAGRRVLVLPGQEAAASFVTKNAIFDPWSSVTWVDSSVPLPKVSTLRCEANFRNQAICEAVAAIFVGLIDIQERYGAAGSAIWEMKQLFENGFNSNVSDETIVGLFGELSVIYAASDPNKLARPWHSNSADFFDFSSDNHRLEVKTSRSNVRNHRFSSNQIGNDLDAKTTIASVILSVVEQGTSMADLVKMITERTSDEISLKLLTVVISTLGTTPELISGMNIDLQATVNSLHFLPAESIPRPHRALGVISMNWIANVDSSLSQADSIDSIINLF